MKISILKNKRLFYIFLLLFVSFFILVRMVFAQTNSHIPSQATSRSSAATTTHNQGTTTASTTTSSQSQGTLNTSNANSNASVKNTHSTTGFQHACSAITKRSDNMVKLAQNVDTVFSKIEARAEEYYQGTLVPKNLILSNYSSLTTIISQNQDQVLADETLVQSGYTTLSCTTPESIHINVQSFNTSMLQLLKDLNIYKKSIVNLIVAISSIKGQ